MKKLILLCSFGLLGTFAFASNEIELDNQNEKLEDGATICNTQTSTDCDGDTVSVTCCRATFEEAYNCAATKLRTVTFSNC